MGNSSNKSYHQPRRKYASQYSLSDMIEGSCSGRSVSVQDESYRPRSRASRRSRSTNALGDNFGSSKTIWPVARLESMFLPEFTVRTDPRETNYDFLKLIAKGAYGRVYKIRNRSNNQIYALKMIGKGKIVEEDAVAQVKQEVSIQEVVGHHPFIARTIEYWQGRKTLYIMMDYLGGGELFSLIEDYGSLPEAVVRIYVGEIGLALDFLHNAGVVHRDVKATNVLLDYEGHAVLIDFGLAKWLRPTHRTSTFCGTPEYMAPEIVKKNFYGHEVDWWSLGVLACFALTNQYPCIQEISEYIDSSTTLQEETIILPNTPELSNGAKDLLRRLLQPDPRTRLKSIFGLQRIAFYMGQDIRRYASKEMAPLRLLGRKIESTNAHPLTPSEQLNFQDFDSFVASSTNKNWSTKFHNS